MVGIPNFDPAPHYAPRKAPANLVRAAQALTAVGVLSIIGGFVAGDASQTRVAILVNLTYFIGLSFGAAAFCAAATITLARWSRPLKRIAESFASFSPIMVVLFLVFMTLGGGLELYEWHHDPSVLHAHKAKWLVGPFFIARNALFLSVLSLLSIAYVRASLRPDLGVAAKSLGDKAPGWWSGIIAGFGDEQEEVEAARTRMGVLAPLIGVFFALGLSLYAFDVTMSLAPHWYANMFGGWFFMSCFWLSMVFLGIISLSFRGWLGIEKYITPTTYHDLGKLIFGFTMFWGYTFYAQLLPIWYGNLTEEIGFLLLRFSVEPWSTLTPVVGAMCFLIPFGTLLSRGIKKMPVGFGIVLSIIALGIWLERFLVTAPNALYNGELWTAASFPVDVFTVGISLGFLGGFVWWVSWFMSNVPAMTITDPYMLPNPMDVHAHSHDDVAHAHH
ncbi:MAG: hypothetical protein H6740_10270 [Alphaproteobacteria bacterium]|nr:hypothetical protein [Alphaproteobacteria bacterium]